MRNNLIILLGARGSGKTTVSNWLREEIPNANLYRLTGHNDPSPAGIEQSAKMYDALMSYLHGMQKCRMHMIFDGIFLAEQAFCLLGYRNYDFTGYCDRYCDRLVKMDYVITVINVICSKEEYERRHDTRGKVKCLNINDSVSESMRQQEVYTQLANNMCYKRPHVRVIDLDTTVTSWKKILGSIFSDIMPNVTKR